MCVLTELVVLAPTWRVHSAIFLFTPSRFHTGHPFHQMLERPVTQQRKKNTTSALWQGPYPSVAAPPDIPWMEISSFPASTPVASHRFLGQWAVWALHEDCRSRVFFADLWSANPMVCFPVSPLLKVAQAKHLGFSTYLVQTANPILGSPSLDR